jgi:hypothetical protein
MPNTRPIIHWVSPLPPAETDIAHYTRRILPALSERAELTLWTDSTTWDKELERFCSVRSLDPLQILPKDMKASEHCSNRPGTLFINMGNAWMFHAGLLMLARRMPSVIVMHDISVQEMLLDAIKNRILSKAEYLSAMHRWYGQKGRTAATRALDGRMSAAQLGQDFPGFELAMEQAIAVLTHTPAASKAVANRGSVPAFQLNLPFQANKSGPKRQAMTGPLRLVQFGHIGPNRRLEEILDALAAMGPDFDFVFDVVGRVWKPDLIKRKCDALGMAAKVRLHGYVSEQHLDALIAQAHLVFNLRHPTMGEASGSQLRIWNAAAASVVTDQGWYAELPRDTVFHVPLDDEILALRDLMERIDKDRSLGQSIGQAGHRHLIAHHNPEQYADGIVEVANSSERDARDTLFANSAKRFLSQSPDIAHLKRARLAQLF